FGMFRTWLMQILAQHSRIILVAVAPLDLLEQLTKRRGSDSEVQIMRQSDLAGDLHVFQHVFDRKMRREIATEHFWQLHRQCVGVTCIDAHGFYEFLERQTLRLHESQGLGCGLNACCGDHISRNLNSAGLANWSDMQDLLTARLKNWTAFTQRFIDPNNVDINQAYFS